MASKNEIRHRLALEGEDEVKRKLQDVGKAGRSAFEGIEKDLGNAAGNREKALREAAGGVRSALSQISEAGSIAGGLGALGATGGGGLIGRLFGSAGPAAALTALSGLALRLAKVSDESERSESRLRSLGGGKKALDDLNASAKKLGVDPSTLQADFEGLLAARQKQIASQTNVIRNPHVPVAEGEAENLPRVFQGGKLAFGAATNDELLAAQRALVAGAKVDQKSPEAARGAISQLLRGLGDPEQGLTAASVRSLAEASPNAGNLLARAVGKHGGLGRGFANAEELAVDIDRQGPISGGKVIGSLVKEEPAAVEAAQAARGVTDAFEGVTAAASRLENQLANVVGKPVSEGLTKAIDHISDNLDRELNPRDFEPGGPKFIGPVNPAERAEFNKPDLIDLGKTLLTGQSDERFAGSNAIKATKFLRDGPAFLQQTPGEAIDAIGGAIRANPIIDFLGKAIANPGGLQEKGRPSDQQQQPPEQPAPGQQSAIESPQQFAGLAASLQTTLQGVLESVAAKAYQLNPTDTKVQTPSTGGIRGEAGDAAATAVAEIQGAGLEVARALSDIAGSIRASKHVEPVTAAGGGAIRLDDGGGISGPGTATSDSIPAMLSDGEYVIRAHAAKKAGLGFLNWLNAGNFAQGGPIRIPRFAQGGLNQFVGNLEIEPAPDGGAIINGNYLPPGSPQLNDPVIQRALAKARGARSGEGEKKKHKSDFTGIFGGHVFDTPGSYAAGGAVGRRGGLGQVSLPGFAEGGAAMIHGDADSLGMGSVAMVDAAAGPALGDLSHFGSLDLTTDYGRARVLGPQDALKSLTAAARDHDATQTGPMPSWRR